MEIGLQKLGLSGMTIDGDYPRNGKMDIDFDEQTPEGLVSFKGSLSKDEVDFLLRFALLSLMARGTLTPEDTPTAPVSLN